MSSTTPARSADQIAADLDAKRERLAGTVAELETRLNPSTLVDKQVQKAKSFFYTDEGEIRWDRVGMAVGGVAGAAIGVRMFSKSVRWLLAVPSNKVKIDAPERVFVPLNEADWAKAAVKLGIAA
ncbi:MAG: DUF3618 domain-containing protein [Candidatus Nanopelagicales bacterium]